MAYARTPAERLKDDRLEAVHSQIVEWKKTRANFPVEGVYQDYRAVFLPSDVPALPSPETLLPAAHNAGVRVIFGASMMGARDGILFLHAPDADFKGTDIFGQPQEEDAARLGSKFKQRSDEAFGADTHAPGALPPQSVLFARTHLPPAKVTKDPTEAYTAAFRHATTHILAPELTVEAISASLAAGHAYVAHDWLCDPTGAAFIAQSYFGVFEMGDTVVHNPLAGSVTIAARLPVPATIRLLRDNTVIAEARDWKLDYIVRDPGAYRLEALLSIDGEERPWIFTNPIVVGPPSNVNLPAVPISSNVDMQPGISYVEGAPADAEKHKLDLYLPRDKKNFPVLVFVHGGSWRSGDRSLYRALGDRFARAGIGVAIPSYRLMPQNPHPAQIEDLAAAFDWVYRNISQHGGDASQIYLSGHAAGAHLSALLALDEKYLKKFDLARNAIRGVIAMSGVYNVDKLDTFVAAADKGDKHDASPVAHAHSGAPPFLVSYCQWDYFGLPKQARDFTLTLKKNFVAARLLYVPGEGHISEVISLVQENGPLVDAILRTISEK
ncbi:MAG: nlhH 1 [Bryobacterales bacterium]|nr:nlhH 1 [Bryobacterales bacterium]